MRYEEALAWLDSIHYRNLPKTELGLGKITALLKLLGDPQEHFKSIHVAGTSGKGSTCTFISSILASHGFKTGLDVSPHVESINERIQLNKRHVSNTELTHLAEAVYPAWQEIALGEAPPSFFEVVTAIAFLHFSRAGVDWAVVETGLGGRRDATNVLHSTASVLTPISLDHVVSLGGTIEQIALEKAGIIKPNSTVVANCNSSALSIVKQTAAQRNCKFLELNRDYSYAIISNSIDGCSFYFQKATRKMALQTTLAGGHQAANASTAIATCDELIALDEASVAHGVSSAFLPCRLEVLSRDPVIIIDGAHNAAKATATADFLSAVFSPQQLQLVIGIVNYKDARSILPPLLKTCTRAYLISPSHEKQFTPPEQLQAIAREIAPYIETSIIDMSQLPEIVTHPVATCVTGSLYLAGIAKKQLLPLAHRVSA